MYDFTHGLFKLPTKEQRLAERNGASNNPFKLAAMLTLKQWIYLTTGMLAWTCDSVDFFSVSLSNARLSELYGKSTNDITTSITLTLLFRPLGAAIFGLVSDRFGRRWPLFFNLLCVSALSLATTYCKSYGPFLAVRSLFGIFMGGIWGMATATALENMPVAPRGLFSGILQQCYALGYLLAASVNVSVVERTDNWKILFWFGAAFSLFSAGVRAVVWESELFLEHQKALREAAASGIDTSTRTKVRKFAQDMWAMLKQHWVRCIYGILLMSGFNWLSHSSQDLYPTMVQKVKLAALPEHEASSLASKATIISNCGAIVGGTIAGYVSQGIGRRLTMAIFVVLSGVLIPAWILPSSFSGLAAGAFWIQFGVQGAWGVVPVYLSEISPPGFRATYSGLAYQLGNMVSASSAQIEARGGEGIRIDNPRFDPAQPVSSTNEPDLPDYATVSGILLGVVCAYLLAVIVVGREERGAHFENDTIAGATTAVRTSLHRDPAAAAATATTDADPEKAPGSGSEKVGPGEEEIEHVGDRHMAPAIDALAPTDAELDEKAADTKVKA